MNYSVKIELFYVSCLKHNLVVIGFSILFLKFLKLVCYVFWLGLFS